VVLVETAAILSPEKTILMPEPGAGCPMADMINGEQLRNWKKQRPDRPVVCYVNTTAEVKAESDICCTSANAVRVVESLESDEVLFAPDKNLAAFVQRNTGKTVIPWNGYCYVHNQIRSSDIKLKKEDFPDAEVWVHPECRPEVIDLADRVLSTGGMVRDARLTKKPEIFIGTETGIVYRLEKENPGKRFIPLRSLSVCHNMKKITLPKLLDALENRRHRVTVPPMVAERARGAIQRMLEIRREE
jgi:quinolinate synthase